MNLKKLLLLCLDNRQTRPQTEKTHLLQAQYIRSILVRPLGFAVGDAVVHTAHLQQLKSIYPQAKIGVLVTLNKNQQVFEASGLVDQIIPRTLKQYIKQRKKWDLLIDFENNFNTSSLIADKILAPKLIMIFRKYHKKYYNFNTVKNFDFHCPQQDTDPLSHYLSNSILASYFTLPAPYSVFSNYHSHNNPYWQANQVHLLICPQGSKRQLPTNELADLLLSSIDDQLKSKVQCMISYTTTANSYIEDLKSLVPQLNISLSPPTDFLQYLNLIEQADIIVAVDGGSLHLGCAFRKPLLSFFANSSPNLQQWQPLVYQGVAQLRLISQHKPSKNSNLTENFDLTEGINWLSSQIKQRVTKLNN